MTDKQWTLLVYWDQHNLNAWIGVWIWWDFLYSLIIFDTWPMLSGGKITPDQRWVSSCTHRYFTSSFKMIIIINRLTLVLLEPFTVSSRFQITRNVTKFDKIAFCRYLHVYVASQIIQYWRIFFININIFHRYKYFFRHLKLEIVLAISASKEWKNRNKQFSRTRVNWDCP